MIQTIYIYVFIDDILQSIGYKTDKRTQCSDSDLERSETFGGFVLNLVQSIKSRFDTTSKRLFM